MSRQFDALLNSGVYLNEDDFREYIEPTNTKELVDAVLLRNEIYEILSSKMHDEDTNGLEDALDIQDAYIHEYEKQIGDYDNSILISNIAYLSKDYGIGTGDLERIIGISAGYISRTAKENSGKKMSIDVVWKIAKVFELDIRTLLEVDLSGITATERYYAKFIDKLIRDSAANKLDWEKEKADNLNYLTLNQEGESYHPLFAEQTFYREGEEYPMQVTEVVFTSDTFGHNTCISGDCFNLRIKNGRYVYLMNICKDVHRVNDETAFAKELWLVDYYGRNQLICKNNEDSSLAEMVNTLYDAVKEAMKHPRIKDDVKNIIDAFMVDDFEDDEGFCPY